MATKPKMIKVCLTNEGDDSETPWAHDLGPAPGGRKVRLINVPFLHAKPTWGDTIVVAPVKDGLPTWDRRGVAWTKIRTRLHTDGGHWAMIVDYQPHDDTSGNDAFRALAIACAELEAVCEGAWGPRGDEPGRTYIAVPEELTAKQLISKLRAESLPCELIQIHPAPTARPVKKPAKRKAASKPLRRAR